MDAPSQTVIMLLVALAIALVVWAVVRRAASFEVRGRGVLVRWKRRR